MGQQKDRDFCYQHVDMQCTLITILSYSSYTELRANICGSFLYCTLVFLLTVHVVVRLGSGKPRF